MERDDCGAHSKHAGAGLSDWCRAPSPLNVIEKVTGPRDDVYEKSARDQVGSERLVLFEREKTCPSCGTRFICSGLWFCWCRTVSLDRQTRSEFSQRYTDCLCRRCLEARPNADELLVSRQVHDR
ncbi:MAG: hypothetical protein C5B57_05535 [Blastocatellia bacterium]|nr:MAG: hypothetical protein C5B57_05535 [Blastocatellia bacterium]